jgi:Ecdysteroid kinase-like family
MTTDALPAAAEPARLTAALRSAGALGEAHVRDVAVESARNTILSRIIRLRLSYDGDAGDAPRSLIFKTGLPERLNAEWAGGRHEVAFYREIAGAMAARLTPRCFDAAWDGETNAWHLLLEDLTDTHHVAADWPIPPTIADSGRMIAALARFHAAWWDDPRLGVGIGTWQDPGEAQLTAFADKFARFADRLGDRLSPERRATYEQLIAAGPRLNARYHTHRNLTILHGDAHIWNIFLPRDGARDDVRFLDWDAWRLDVATDDLAYMMALHWYPEHRRRCERALLDRYHAELVAHGVAGYDRRALDDDYRLSALWQMTTPVWQAAINIPPWVWWPHLERIFVAIDDLGCRELLAG